MSERIDEIESRLRDMGAAQPPVRESGSGEGVSGEPGGSPGTQEEPEPAGKKPSEDGAEAPVEVDSRVDTEHAAGELRVPDGYSVLEGGVDGRRAVAVVVSRFNGEITNRLLERALEELQEVGVTPESIMVMPVPGAFELPLAAMALAKTRRYACVVALGCVIRGETPHFEYVASEAASGLQLAALETGVPVSFGVLTVDTREQAEERIDRAADAVRTALEMADVFSQLRAQAAGGLH
jgi:6,7-dimethyl-8-ribityllumazine synthase